MNQTNLHRHAEMKWPEFAAFVKKVNFAILPVGAIEQHGPPLPMNTDVLIADYLGQRVAETTGGLLMDTLHYTPSFSLRLFPGTVRVSDQTFANMLVEIVESIATHGIKPVYTLVGHIGAADACKDAERQLLLTSQARMVNLVLPGLNEVVAQHCQSKRWHPGIVHAEEYETSCVLFLRPELVDMSKAVKEYPTRDPLFGPISLPWNEFTKSGVVGDATLASAEKGRIMLDQIASQSVELIRLHQESLKKKRKNLAV